MWVCFGRYAFNSVWYHSTSGYSDEQIVHAQIYLQDSKYVNSRNRPLRMDFRSQLVASQCLWCLSPLGLAFSVCYLIVMASCTLVLFAQLSSFSALLQVRLLLSLDLVSFLSFLPQFPSLCSFSHLLQSLSVCVSLFLLFALYAA